jgi:hypothetical protein
VRPTYKLQVKTWSGAWTHAPPHALQHRTLPPIQSGLWGCHVPSGSGSRLPDRKDSSATMCTVDPYPAPYKRWLRCTTCPTTSDPTSLEGRAPERHVSYGSRSCLPTGRVLVPPPHALRFPVDHRLKHKEKTSGSACAARHACSQCTCVCFQCV